MKDNNNFSEKGGEMKRKVFITFVALLVISFLVVGLTPKDKKTSTDGSLEERIKALEYEISELKTLLKHDPGGNLKKDVVQDESKVPMGPRVWTEGTRGWDESGGTDIWTLGYEVGIGTAVPGYELDIAGDLRITGGIHDGGLTAFGNASDVLVSDGAGGVAWGATPGGSGFYIWNQSAAMRAEDFWMDGVGQAGDGVNVTGLIAGVGNSGVFGQSNDNSGGGVFGDGLTAATGVYGQTNVDTYYGMWGYNANASGTGIVGAGNGAVSMYLIGGSGVAGSGSNVGVFGYGDATNGSYGVYAVSNAADAAGFGVRAHNTVVGGCGIFGTGNGVAAGSYWGGSGVSGSSDDVGVFGYGDATMYSWAMLGSCDADTGIGVYGFATGAGAFGMRAHSDDAAGNGLVASGNGVGGVFLTGGGGVCGTSSNVGVYARGDATAGSQGIYARSLAGDGLGIQSAGNNLTPWTFGAGGGIEATGSARGITGFGDAATGAMGLYGYCLSTSGGAGVFARHAGTSGTGSIGLGNGGGTYVTLTAGSGGAFTGDSIGVAGYSIGASGTRAGGYFDNFNGTNYAYVALDWGLGYKINGSGAVSTIMETRSGRKNLFAPESPEAWFEDIGEGQLRNGSSGKILLDPLFIDCITVDNEHPLKIFVQLLDNCNGVYVKRYDDGFEVIELNGGTSDAKFCYRVIGSWKGYENARFPDAPPRLAGNVNDVSRDKVVKTAIEEREVDDSKMITNIRTVKKGNALKIKMNSILSRSLDLMKPEKKNSQ